MLRDAGALRFRSNHESRDVLQEQKRDMTLVAQFDEMGALDR